MIQHSLFLKDELILMGRNTAFNRKAVQPREVGRDKRGAPQPAGGANENESRKGHTIRASKIDSMCRAETFGELAYVRRAAIPPAKDYHPRINPISRSHDTLYRVELNITAMMYYQQNQFTWCVWSLRTKHTKI